MQTRRFVHEGNHFEESNLHMLATSTAYCTNVIIRNKVKFSTSRYGIVVSDGSDLNESLSSIRASMPLKRIKQDPNGTDLL